MTSPLPPHGATPHQLLAAVSTLLAYVLCLLTAGVHWKPPSSLRPDFLPADGTVLWANFALLFQLSLIPLGAAWIGGEILRLSPAAFYGALAWLITRTINRLRGANSLLHATLSPDRKDKLSPPLCAAGIAALIASRARRPPLNYLQFPHPSRPRHPRARSLTQCALEATGPRTTSAMQSTSAGLIKTRPRKSSGRKHAARCNRFPRLPTCLPPARRSRPG